MAITGIILSGVGLILIVGALCSPHPLEYFTSGPSNVTTYRFVRFVDTWWPFIFAAGVLMLLGGAFIMLPLLFG